MDLATDPCIVEFRLDADVLPFLFVLGSKDLDLVGFQRAARDHSQHNTTLIYSRLRISPVSICSVWKKEWYVSGIMRHNLAISGNEIIHGRFEPILQVLRSKGVL